MIFEERDGKTFGIFADMLFSNITVLPKKVNGYAALKATHAFNLAGRLVSEEFTVSSDAEHFYSVGQCVGRLTLRSDDPSFSPKGAPYMKGILPLATVTFTNRQTGKVYLGVRDARSPDDYWVKGLVTGSYDITASIPTMPELGRRIDIMWILYPSFGVGTEFAVARERYSNTLRLGYQ